MAITPTKNGWLVNIQPGGREGRRIRRTFRLKEMAEKFAREKEDEAERLIAGVTANVTIIDLINKFDGHAKLRFRGYRYEKYRLARFRRFFADGKPSAFSLPAINSFIDAEKIRGLADGSLGRDIAIFKRMASWAVENGLLAFNPLEKLKRIRGAKRTRWLNDNEIKIVLQSCQEYCPEIYEPVLVALLTGFRLSNVLALRHEDFEEYLVWARKTKTGKPYAVPIDPRLRPLITEFKKREGILFPAANLDKKFKEVMTKIGFYKGKNHPNSVVFHTLRHSFGAYWLNRKVPIYTVSQWLGHSSVTMTESVYAHLSLQHHIELMNEEAVSGRQLVDAHIIPFPQNPSVSDGPPRNRTENLVLKSDKP